MDARGTLIVVGTGIQGGAQTTLAARMAIERADRVLFAVADARTAQWIRAISPSAEPFRYPRDGTPRRQIYGDMVSRILEEVRTGAKVCAVFYGHPGVLADAPREALRAAREEGHATKMLPGISFLDCLFCDLGIDPGRDGCQMYEADSFLRRRPAFDRRAPLVLCQIGLIGNRSAFDPGDGSRVRAGLRELTAALQDSYEPDREVVIYEASTDPWEPPRAARMELGSLPEAEVSDVSTLVILPRRA